MTGFPLAGLHRFSPACVLADDFADMATHHYIVNGYLYAYGLNVHKSCEYLVNPVVAQVIADWWRRP